MLCKSPTRSSRWRLSRFSEPEEDLHEQRRSYFRHRRQPSPPVLQSRRVACLNSTPAAGRDLEIFELDGIPGFSEDEERNPPAKVAELKQRIRSADAILIVTPEYNYSVPGVLKNAIDWASRPYGDSAWSGKPVAIMGASIGNMGTARAQYHLRQSFVFLNMYPVQQPEVMIGNAAQRFDAQGNLTDEPTKDHIRRLLQSLVDWTRRIGQSQAR